MSNLKIDPSPDFTRFEKVLRREGVPDRVPFYELFSNIEAEVLNAIDVKHEKFLPEIGDLKIQRHLAYMYHLGYDYCNIDAPNFEFPIKERPKAETDQGDRSYFMASTSNINNRADFEKYPWPIMANIDYSPIEKVEKHLPEGFKIVSIGNGGILENVMWLLGFEGTCMMIYEDPELLKEAFEYCAVRIIEYYDTVASFDCVGAVAMGEDMGYKTQTFFSPEVFEEYIFPWHRKLVETVNKHDKPFILHACGNLTQIMPQLIDCGWAAKHSFENIIEPVWEAKKKYGDRIALLGGFDLDKLCRSSEEDIREHTRYLIDNCSEGGGWAMGTGNSVPNYVPVENFLTMMEEGFNYHP